MPRIATKVYSRTVCASSSAVEQIRDSFVGQILCGISQKYRELTKYVIHEPVLPREIRNHDKKMTRN